MVAPIAAPAREVGLWKSRVGLSPAGTVSLAAVVSVLVFVSLARLRPLMTHENEVDARQTALLLAAQLADWSATDGRPGQVPLLEELAGEGAVRQALSDGVFEEGGRVLKRHGYLFSVVELPPGRPVMPERGTVQAASSGTGTEGGGELGIRAWPWRHGSSGRVALLCTQAGRLFQHANTPVRWSGPQAASGSVSTWTGWTE